MKTKLLIFALIFGITLHAQIDNRVEIFGQIIVEGNDLEGITIFNKTLKKGTLSDDKGNFVLPAKLNDTLQIRALQYQDFDVVVNATTIQTRMLRMFLIEEITQLEEVVVSDSQLSGVLQKDMTKIEVFEPKRDVMYFAVNPNTSAPESPSAFARNDIEISKHTSQNKPLVNGLNLVNVVDQLLLPLFRSGVKNKAEKGVPEVPVSSLKYYFGSEFLGDNFNIPKHRVDAFIRFVENENFDYTLLNYGRELEFLELLNSMSEAFLKSE